MERFFTTLGIALLTASAVLAQDFTLWGGLPSFQFSGALNERVDYFFQTGAETYWWESSEGNSTSDFRVRHVDLSGGLTTDLGTDWNLAVNFLFRRRRPFDDRPGWELRPWAQITHVARAGKYRIRNRLRSEQRFEQPQKSEDWEFDMRLRYRLSVDFPLEGERLDEREFYLNSSIAMLLTLTQDDFWFYRNPRAYTGLGYRLNGKNKLETGFEYRTKNEDETGADEHVVFWRLNWVRSI